MKIMGVSVFVLLALAVAVWLGAKYPGAIKSLPLIGGTV